MAMAIFFRLARRGLAPKQCVLNVVAVNGLKTFDLRLR